MKTGKELKDAARKKSFAQKSEFHDTNVVAPGEGPVAQVGSGIGSETAALAPQATALVPPSPIAQVDRRAALGAILTGGAAALLAPIIPGGNYDVGLPGSPTDGVFRKMMILSAPSGFPDDGSYTGLGWYHDGWSGINLGSWKAGVLQVGWDGTTGALTAGAGAVALDQNGETWLCDSVYASPKSAKWVTSDNVRMADIVGSYTGAAPNRSAHLDIYPTAEASGTGDSVLYLGVRGATNPVSSFNSITISNLTAPFLAYADKYGNMGSLHYGDYGVRFSKTISTVASTLYTRTIKANALGTTGFVRTCLFFSLLNNSGGSRTYTLKYNFGGFSQTIFSTGLINHATSRHVIWVEVVTFNDAATGTQEHQISEKREGTTAAGTLSALGENILGFNTSSVDTTGDVTLSFTLTSGVDTATQTAKGVAYEDGPYNG